MRYSGSVYRPPSEAYSLILQVTLGCSHNKCAFCNMYKDKKFSIRSQEDIFADLDWARTQYPRVEKLFLADGDALILPMERLTPLLERVHTLFPECRQISTYASPKSILGKSAEELASLRKSGLALAYLGLETGSDALLEKINKGVTVAQQIECGQKLKAAGIALSVTAINGLAGSNGDWQTHAVDTATALSAMRPDYIALLTLRVYTGTPMAEWVASGELVEPTPMELIRETKLLLEHIDCPGAVFRSNHASNYLPLAGTLNDDREHMIRQCGDALRGDAALRRFVELGH